IDASKQALKRAKMTIDDIDIVEINEAFAAQVIPSARGIGVDPFSDKLNPHGGAIALGHPFGMTGARILCTLLNGLRETDKTFGLVKNKTTPFSALKGPASRLLLVPPRLSRDVPKLL